MEGNYAEDPQMLARLMKEMVSAMFETPVKGKDIVNGPRLALEMKIEESINKSLSKSDKDAFNSCINHIMLRIQDFSTTDLDIPSKLEGERKNSKEELLAVRYSIEIKTNDLKNVTAGGYYSEKVVNFFSNFLNEKKQKIDKIYDKLIFDCSYADQIFANFELNKDGFKKSLKSIESFLGVPYGFKKLKRVFFIGLARSKKYYLIEYVRRNYLINEKIKSTSILSPRGLGKKNEVKIDKNNVLILYDTLAEYDNTKSEVILGEWRDFIYFLLTESGEKIDYDDFSMIIGTKYSNSNIYESGSLICQYLTILFEQDLEYDTNMLNLINNKDLAHVRNRIKNLIETIGIRSEVSEYILRKY